MLGNGIGGEEEERHRGQMKELRSQLGYFLAGRPKASRLAAWSLRVLSCQMEVRPTSQQHRAEGGLLMEALGGNTSSPQSTCQAHT